MCQGEVVREVAEAHITLHSHVAVAEVTQARITVNVQSIQWCFLSAQQTLSISRVFSGASSVHSRHCQSPEYSVRLPQCTAQCGDREAGFQPR